MDIFAGNFSVLEMIGVCGFFAYVGAYTMLTLRILPGDSVAYFTVNLAASCMVMVGLMASFNLASALIQGFWITMSIVGITMRVSRGASGRLL